MRSRMTAYVVDVKLRGIENSNAIQLEIYIK